MSHSQKKNGKIKNQNQISGKERGREVNTRSPQMCLFSSILQYPQYLKEVHRDPKMLSRNLRTNTGMTLQKKRRMIIIRYSELSKKCGMYQERKTLTEITKMSPNVIQRMSQTFMNVLSVRQNRGEME